MAFEPIVPTPPPPPTAPAGKSGGSSWLTGCLAGCGVLVLLSVIGIAVASYWAFTPGQQHATDAIWQDEAVVYFRMDDILADEGAKAVIFKAWQAMVDADNRRKREALPENLGWLADLDKQNQQPGGLGMVMPSQISVVVLPPPPEGGEGPVVAAMNFRALVRPFRSFILWASSRDDREQGRPREYKGFPILDMEHGNFLAFADSTVIFGSSLPALEGALDRIASGTAERRKIDLPEGRWDMIGSSNNRHGGVESLLAKVAAFTDDEVVFSDDDETYDDTYDESEETADPERSADVAVEMPPEGDELEEVEPEAAAPEPEPRLGDAELGWGIDFESADRAICKLRLKVADPAELAAWEQRLRATVAELQTDFAEDGLTLDSTFEVEGQTIDGELRLRGLERSIEQFFTDLVPTYENG